MRSSSRGYCFQQLSLNRKAQKDYEVALQHDAGNLQALVRQGEVLYALKRTQVRTSGTPRRTSEITTRPAVCMPPMHLGSVCCGKRQHAHPDNTPRQPLILVATDRLQEAKELWEKASACDLLSGDITLVLRAQVTSPSSYGMANLPRLQDCAPL